jgi:hypothetical protein
MEDHKTIEEIYNRLLSIQNEFLDLGELLTNNMVVDEILKVMQALMMHSLWMNYTLICVASRRS